MKTVYAKRLLQISKRYLQNVLKYVNVRGCIDCIKMGKKWHQTYANFIHISKQSAGQIELSRGHTKVNDTTVVTVILELRVLQDEKTQQTNNNNN